MNIVLRPRLVEQLNEGLSSDRKLTLISASAGFGKTTLVSEWVAALPGHFILVLDDYHVIDAKPVGHALAFLLEHLPAQMHLVIATREDPQLPLARLRARDQLTELRAADFLSHWGPFFL